MKRRRETRLFLFSLLLAVALMGGNGAARWNKGRVPVVYENRIMGVPVVSDYSFLEEKERITSSVNPGVCFEGTLLPYDQGGRCYLPQDMTERWTGRLSVQNGVEDFFLCMPQDSYLIQKKEAVRENHDFTLWMVGEGCYYELKLVASGMPIISIETEREEEPEDVVYELDPDKWMFDSDILYYGTISVFNPGVNTKRYEILQSRVRYHEKGGITRGFYKRSYSLSLQDQNEENLNVPLLGMRADNLWKLNSLVTDPNRIREKTASEIWEQFDLADASVNEQGPREEYVELVLDNQYRGVYCLVEPVDEKKLSLDSNDVLYKMYGEEAPEDEDFQLSIDEQWKLNSTIRIRYPEAIGDYEIAWKPMRDYMNTFFRGGTLLFQTVTERIDLANMSDNLLFLMVCTASDNLYKNNYYAARAAHSGEFRMYRVPWDLDLTFGNQFELSEHSKSVFNEDYTIVYQMGEFEAILESAPETVGNFILKRYQEYRKTFLSTEYIQNLMVNNRDYLIDTGAIEREKERWPEETVDMDIDYLLEYQSKRMEWLDTYFQEYFMQKVQK